MDVPSDPAAMQAFVLEQMLKGRGEEPQQESRAPARFAKQMGELIESKLRDRLHHEICAIPRELTTTKLLQPSQTPNMSISVLWDSTEKPLGILKCDGLMRSLLGRLCFGGDTDSPVIASGRPATESEIGLQQLFAKQIATALEETGLASVSNLTTLRETEFESDEFENREAYTFPFELQMGPTTTRLELTVSQSLVLGHAEVSETSQMDSVGTTNDEMMQTPVLASVRLKQQPTTLGRIRSLQVGDCLPLIGEDQLNGQFMVSGQEIFDCQIGRSGDAYSLKISNRANPEPNPIQALTPIG